VHGYEQDKPQAQFYLYFMNTVKPQDQKIKIWITQFRIIHFFSMHAYLLFGWWEVLVLLNRETGSLCLCYKHQPRNWKQFSSQLKPANKNLCCQTLILVHSFNWLLFKSFHTDFDTKSLHSSMAFMILSLTSLEPMTDSCTDNTIIAPLQAGHIDSNCISSLFSPFYSAPLILRLQLGPSEPFFFVFW